MTLKALPTIRPTTAELEKQFQSDPHQFLADINKSFDDQKSHSQTKEIVLRALEKGVDDNLLVHILEFSANLNQPISHQYFDNLYQHQSPDVKVAFLNLLRTGNLQVDPQKFVTLLQEELAAAKNGQDTQVLEAAIDLALQIPSAKLILRSIKIYFRDQLISSILGLQKPGLTRPQAVKLTESKIRAEIITDKLAALA